MDASRENRMEEQFLRAYDEHADALFRYAYFRVYDTELAKDLLQDAYTKAWIYIADGNKVENLRAFLYKVLHNLIVDHIRKKKTISLENLLEEGFSPEGEGRGDIERIVSAREVMEVLSQIEPGYRDIVHMRYIDDMSPKEIAKILGVSENLVSVKIHRGLKKLKDVLVEKGMKNL